MKKLPTAKQLIADASGVKSVEEQRKFEVKSDDGKLALESISERISTLEQALDHAKVDRTVWEVDRYTINSWECAAKYDDGLRTITLFQVKAFLRRLVTETAQSALEKLCKQLAKPRSLRHMGRKCKSKDPHMLVVALFDAHFGKMAWRRRSGQDDNLHLKRDVYLKAVDELIAKTGHLDIEQIEFPIGHDFYHVDSAGGTTTAGTKVDWNGLVSDMIEVGMDAVFYAVDRLLEIAPVHAVYVGGNHDRMLSLMLMYVMRERYAKDKRFSIDYEPMTRKYIRYGVNLIGYAHGDLVKVDKLFSLMPSEVPQLWAETEYHEWLTGHGHRSEVWKTQETTSKAGQVARMLCSISGTDAWHYDSAFINGRRAAEAYIYSKKHGYAGHVVANVEA